MQRRLQKRAEASFLVEDVGPGSVLQSSTKKPIDILRAMGAAACAHPSGRSRTVDRPEE